MAAAAAGTVSTADCDPLCHAVLFGGLLELVCLMQHLLLLQGGIRSRVATGCSRCAYCGCVQVGVVCGCHQCVLRCQPVCLLLYRLPYAYSKYCV